MTTAQTIIGYSPIVPLALAAAFGVLRLHRRGPRWLRRRLGLR